MSKKRLTYADITKDEFGIFKTDKERIKYMSKAYKDKSIANVFKEFYNLEIEVTDKYVREVTNIELGNIYTGTVKSFTKSGISFDMDGVKNEIFCKEPLWECRDYINNYLLTHDNKLLFEVREKNRDTYYVSVINAYYDLWRKNIDKIIKTESHGIGVHVDALVKGGYLCHTTINELCELTGKTYTNTVFIPGSQIVLNIERDFEKWIGQDVYVLPQNFVKYKNYGPMTEYSLVGSRKKILQVLGMNNMYELYNTYKLAQKNNSSDITMTLTGKVTGIINSNKKTGIFIELDDKYITGLANIPVIDLLNYHPGDSVTVKIVEFECADGRDPFYFKGNKLVRCNVRPVFEIV